MTRGKRQSADPAEREAEAGVIKTEGQRMLIHVVGSLQAIAAECEVNAIQSIVNWRTGVTIPSQKYRAKMWAAFGIPVEAWDRPPHTLPVVPDAPPPATFDPDAPAASTLDECRALLAVTKRARLSANVSTSEMVRLASAEASLLKLRAELEHRAELTEDRYVREHPAWLRAKREISRVLMQYPEAARAVAEALMRLNV